MRDQTRAALTSVTKLGLCIATSLAVGVSLAQTTPLVPPRDEFTTLAATEAWDAWRAALQALLEQDASAAEDALAALLDEDPSPLRLALLEQRSVEETSLGGGVLLLEQDEAAGRLGAAGRQVVTRLQEGRERLLEASDGWYFATLGRFDISAANFAALLDHDPDPVALLQLADQRPQQHAIVVRLAGHPEMGAVVRELLDVLREGERRVKADPGRIRRNVQRLAGPPRAFENAVALLQDSGEYAVPALLEALRDPARQALRLPILQALPQIDRPALNPLLAALDADDAVLKVDIIQALARIGDARAAPYLLALAQSDDADQQIRQAARDALRVMTLPAEIDRDAPAARALMTLAEWYYANRGSVAADERLDTANVWYWRDGVLVDVAVPTEIFDEVMCMRLCNQALQIDSDYAAPIPLWLAANFRRVAQLGDREDNTRPDDFPAADYFALAAGPGACQMTLMRGVERVESSVALGAIRALRHTAGRSNLLASQDGDPALARALAFPDRNVRIEAALALANALPDETFPGYQNLMPVLSEALRLHTGRRAALVVDPDDQSANAVAAALQNAGFEVRVALDLTVGRNVARSELPGLDVILLASDIADPGLAAGLADLADEFRFAGTPVVMLVKPGAEDRVAELRFNQPTRAAVEADASSGELLDAVARVTGAAGMELVTPERGVSLAMQTAAALRELAVDRNANFQPRAVLPALLDAFTTEDDALQSAVALVLTYIDDADAQQTLARAALDDAAPLDRRLLMFDMVAQAAKRHGNLIADEQVAEIVNLAQGEPDPELRTAAAQAMGALDLPPSPASTIIRDLHQG